MQVRTQRNQPAAMPAPLAPVARDANPWPWPMTARGRLDPRRDPRTTSPRVEQMQRIIREHQARTQAGPHGQAPRRGGLAAIVPFGMFLVAIGIVASGAIEALGRGAGLRALLPVLVFALIFGVGAWRRLRRRARGD
jgi:hypothetical protein